MKVIGYILLAWFVGMIAWDLSKPKIKGRESGDIIYQFRKIDGNKVIVSYKAFGYSTCRPITLIPYLFGRGKLYECAKDGELDFCTGEVKRGGRWIKPEDNIETPYFGEIK